MKTTPDETEDPIRAFTVRFLALAAVAAGLFLTRQLRPQEKPRVSVERDDTSRTIELEALRQAGL